MFYIMKSIIFSVVLKFLTTFYICINVFKFFFTVYGNHYNFFLSINLVKLHNTL